MDNDVVKFTCLPTQIPSYFTKLDKLEDVERAAKELKNYQQQLDGEQRGDLASGSETKEESLLGKRNRGKADELDAVFTQNMQKTNLNDIPEYKDLPAFPQLLPN